MSCRRKRLLQKKLQPYKPQCPKPPKPFKPSKPYKLEYQVHQLMGAKAGPSPVTWRTAGRNGEGGKSASSGGLNHGIIGNI